MHFTKQIVPMAFHVAENQENQSFEVYKRKFMFPFIQSNINSNNTSRHGSLNDIVDYEKYAENVISNSEKIDEEKYRIMKGNFLKIIRTQNGSRLLQKTIKKTNKDILGCILDEILIHVPNLIVDPYANYFCQKFFNSLKSNDKLRWLNQIRPSLVSICKSKIGTYPVQSFIENLTNTKEKEILIGSLINHIIELSTVFNC